MANESQWFVYIIQATDGRLYTGITTDYERRFREHLSGNKGAKFFRGRKPKAMVYLELAENRSNASQREYAIKKLTRSQKQALIKSIKNTLSAPLIA